MQNDLSRLSIGKAAKFLGVSIDTLRRWERKRTIESHRSPGGHRYFLKEELQKVFGKKYQRVITSKESPQPKEVLSPERQTNPVHPPRKRDAQRVLFIFFIIFVLLDIVLVGAYFILSRETISPIH